MLLLIEIAATPVTYERKRKCKVRLYAEAGVPELWLINLPAGRIEVYAHPADSTYQESFEVTADTTFTSPTVAGLKLAAADVLGG